jgi:hypothetical protein
LATTNVPFGGIAEEEHNLYFVYRFHFFMVKVLN